MNIQKYIKLAKKEAEKSKFGVWKIGSIIIKGKTIIGVGHNKFSGRMKMVEIKYNVQLYSLHAEMMSIMNCNENLDGAVMFIAGIYKSGRWVNCRPCKDCRKIIKNMPFKAIYYETQDGIEAWFPHPVN